MQIVICDENKSSCWRGQGELPGEISNVSTNISHFSRDYSLTSDDGLIFVLDCIQGILSIFPMFPGLFLLALVGQPLKHRKFVFFPGSLSAFIRQCCHFKLVNSNTSLFTGTSCCCLYIHAVGNWEPF